MSNLPDYSARYERDDAPKKSSYAIYDTCLALALGVLWLLVMWSMTIIVFAM